MDLFDVIRSCARRWYVLIPLLLVVGWFSYDVYSSVKPVYYSSAVIGLAPPSVRVEDTPPGVPLARNGLLDVGGAALIANMTAVGLQEPSVVARVVAAGGLPTYAAKMFPVPATMGQLPLVMVEVTDPNPAAVTQTLDLVIPQAEVTLRNLQQNANVPNDQMVAPFVVSPPGPPAAATPSRTRSTVAIFVAGAGLVTVVTVIVDVLLVRLGKRERRRSSVPTEVVAEPPPVADPRDDCEPAPFVRDSRDVLEAR
jgi:hypothetical protein